MAGLWVVGEVTADGSLARISTEVATLARTLAEAAGQDVAGIVVAADPKAAAAELATYLPRVLALAFRIRRQPVDCCGPGRWPATIPVVAGGHRHAEYALAPGRADLSTRDRLGSEVAMKLAVTSVGTALGQQLDRLQSMRCLNGVLRGKNLRQIAG